MTFFLTLSQYTVLVNSCLVLVLLFESRLSKRATRISVIALFAILFIVNMGGLYTLGVDRMAKLQGITATLPSLVFFWAISRYRGMRFLFTYCVADVFCLWITYLTGMFNIWDSEWKYAAIFVSRILLFACLDFYIYYFLRKDYQTVQRVLKKGWGSFTGVCVLFYTLLLVASAYPALIWFRPQELPTYILLLIVIPFVLHAMLYSLTRQVRYQLADAQQKMARIQLDAMNRQLSSLIASEERMRIFRHDVRHHINHLTSVLQTGDCAAALDLLTHFGQHAAVPQSKRYCANPTVNAMLSHYLQQAESQGMAVNARLVIPADLPIDAIDLSTMLANALENACNACAKLPASQRRIDIVAACRSGQFLLDISNPYKGTVLFDERGLPMSASNEHGIGSLSIAAFARKYDAVWDYQTGNGVFRLRLLIPLAAYMPSTSEPTEENAP